ncbi:ribonuclease H-like domain-containing protein [Tanacetum coccineum]|uniref:Ribonuclease H-like domain-containing protein n=1 Tax=Tanacetum coccineum TaxID=301880 RepID=A0ABQ5DCH8_9ASTR
METEEISDRFVAPYFVNGLEAYDGEINLGVEENMISNEFAVKLCLDHEVKSGNKVVKKELIVALRGEVYFVKFILNPEEDDVEPGVVFGRSFLRLTKAIADFRTGTVTIYPELDPFLVSSEEEEKISDDWDLLLDDLDFGDILDIEGVDVPQFVCKMGKNSRNKRRQLENYKLTYSDMGPSMSTGKPLTQEEAEREALAISIYERYSLLEDERPIIEIMAYSDKYKKILDGICLDKMKLDGMDKEEEEASKINLNALADTGSDINRMPYRVYKEIGREEVKNVKKGITMLNHSKAKPMGLLKDVLCQVGVTTIITKFLIPDMPIDRDTPILVGRGFLYTCGSILNTIDRITPTFDGICHQSFRATQTSLDTAESDSDDEKEYAIQRNKFGAPIYGPKPARYLNCSDSLDRSLALPEVLNPFKKICVWKKVVSFLGSLRVTLQHAEWKPDYTGCFNRKEDSDGQWHAQIRLTDPYGNIYDKGFTIRKHDDEAGSSRPKRSRQYETMEVVLLPQVHYEFLQWEGCNKDTKSRINLCEAGTNEEIFTYVVWIGAFNINEPIYSELCHEFYSTYEFDEVCANDELKTKKIIKFRLGGRAHSLALLEFARRLGLYHSEELDAESFDVHQNGYANVAWFIARWMTRKGAGTQRDNMICCGQFITKIARKARVLSDEDFFERMSSMEMQQGAIERMSYRQSYHWDRYARVFEHMAGVYSVPLQGAYNQPGYAQPQYD